MSDSQFCQVHWRDADLVNADIDWELEDLPDDMIEVPLNLQPVSAESEQAAYEQEELEMEQKWTDADLPMAVDPREPQLGGDLPMV
ncbi:hypothetical protein BGZ88_005831 [Linnemannia elongata]|uniref:Anaphase-promoting complex subunit 13 n=2 Tax=Mortierellaceae TaxID=4854 RepID=A0A9P6K5F2_9FUNG|nr:hypothetical protein BGZ88_005831 [Linnemannia elongata]KAF9546772.1 hypothetical protein EC957_009377 [Mortierella hygrophila]KAG0069374.1 hypothetical protein BGZ89_002996 [Linnemannia elongata]KAG9070823.1 hypothetical protein KI688_008364 [Linnemannia hyalina]